MTIEYVKGDLLSVQEGIIIHGCNAQGVMGSGVAKAIRNTYPMAYEFYKQDYEFRNGSVPLGSMSKCWVNDDLLIINAITQNAFGRDGSRFVNYGAIVDVFKEALSIAYCYSYPLNFPKIGSGLGGGDWNIIEQLINDCDYTDSVKKICWEL